MPDWSAILVELSATGGKYTLRSDPTSVGGGDISAAWRICCDERDLFVKTGSPTSLSMYEAESAGLAAIAGSGTIRVPAVIGSGVTNNHAWLALEWLNLEATVAKTDAKLGEQLALLHQNTADRFGWHRDNTIGRTPQRNTWSDSWPAFFSEHRLGFQLQLASENGFSGRLQDSGEQLLERVPAFLTAASTKPALLHGDLWSGNYASCDGFPVVFDPAVYYGDPETDLAMTRLFGGFGDAFYSAYHSALPLCEGHEARRDLYQLYHVLNHLNLFGSGYLARAQQLIDRLLVHY